MLEEYEATAIGFPTLYTRPTWDRPLLRERAKVSLNIGDISVRHISSEFNLERGLMASPYVPNYPKTLSPRRLKGLIEAEGCVIAEPDVVEWMIYCACTNVVIEQRIAEMNRALRITPKEEITKSQTTIRGEPVRITSQWRHDYSNQAAVGASNDAASPGVAVADVSFQKYIPGSRIASDGYATVRTPRGNYRVPAAVGQFEPGGTKLGAFRDHLSWGSVAGCYGYQWRGSLVKYIKLINTPVTSAVGHIMDWAENNAPNIFVAAPTRPKLTATIRTRVSSGNDQKMVFRFRDTDNYSNVRGERTVAVAKGTSDVETTMTAFPYVVPQVVEMQPEAGAETKEEEMVVV